MLYYDSLCLLIVVTGGESKQAPAEIDEDDDVPDLVENFDEASKDD